MIKKLLLLDFWPTRIDVALLVLRISTGLLLFTKHGLEKLLNFSAMAQHFPDPLHIGSSPSLAFALISDAICSILLVLGLGTRVAALFIAINLIAAFSLVHHLALFSPMNGELPCVYLGVALTLVLSGGGRFSLDQKILGDS